MTSVASKLEVVPIAQLVPLMSAAIADGKPVELTVTGNSMRPLLKDRVSSVRLVRPDNLQTGDIVFFQRGDGRYVLHRITAIHDGAYDIVGDNQYAVDRDIPESCIMAKVGAYNRNGKRWKENDAIYRALLPGVKALRYYAYRIKRKIVSS